jgi:hypothetical protein
MCATPSSGRRPFVRLYCNIARIIAPGDVAELADALDLGSSGRKVVQVQLLSSPKDRCQVSGVRDSNSDIPYLATSCELEAHSVEKRNFNPQIVGFESRRADYFSGCARVRMWPVAPAIRAGLATEPLG